MQILKDPTTAFEQSTAVILGNFDGFHRAHAALAACALAYARQNGLVPAAFSLLSPPDKGQPLTTPEKKAEYLKKAGIEVLFSFEFETIRDLSAEAFVSDILLSRLQAKAVFCGFNYRFGKGRSGDTERLRALLPPQVELFILPAQYTKDKTLISSSAIRALIKEGNLARAEEMLGHRL